MTLTYIWMSFFLLSFIVAFIKWAFLGDHQILPALVEGIFKAANDGFDISLKLVGVMALFLGFMNIGERAGAIRFLSRIVGPFFFAAISRYTEEPSRYRPDDDEFFS